MQGTGRGSRLYRIYLLSPANAGGERARALLSNRAQFDLAVRLRQGTATLGETFAFISGLYFRGKLAYSQAFGAPPPGIPGAFVITAGQGLLPPETTMRLEDLERIAQVAIDAVNPAYREPLERDSRRIQKDAGAECDFVLLGSVATLKYSQPLAAVFGERLLFPEEFAGRGDMSRGALMLRCARAGTPLTYVPVGAFTRHGPRPPKLPPPGRLRCS